MYYNIAHYIYHLVSKLNYSIGLTIRNLSCFVDLMMSLARCTDASENACRHHDYSKYAQSYYQALIRGFRFFIEVSVWHFLCTSTIDTLIFLRALWIITTMTSWFTIIFITVFVFFTITVVAARFAFLFAKTIKWIIKSIMKHSQLENLKSW